MALYLDRNMSSDQNVLRHNRISAEASLRQAEKIYNSHNIKYSQSDEIYSDARISQEDKVSSDSDQEVMKILNSINWYERISQE